MMTKIMIYKSLLKNTNKTVKKLINEGYEIEAFKGLVNGRKAFYVNGELLTDYELVNRFPLAYSI